MRLHLDSTTSRRAGFLTCRKGRANLKSGRLGNLPYAPWTARSKVALSNCARSLLFASACTFAVLASALPCPGRTLWVDASSEAQVEDGSPDAPFTTIAGAIEVVAPGDVVTIRGGVYREIMRLPSGEPGKPITLRAAEGQRVVISGCEKLEGWQNANDGIWSTTLDWKPRRLFVAGRPQTIARTPNEGWWAVTGATEDTLIDSVHLAGLEAAATGGQVRVWLKHGNTFATRPIVSLDTAKGQVTLGELSKWDRFTDRDMYYLENRRALIDRPGEWAVEPDGQRFRVFFKPVDPADLDRVEAPKAERSILFARGADHLRIEGLELTGSQRNGIELYDVEDVEVRRCLAYHNGGTGISFREITDGRIAQCIAWRNEYGISVGYSSRVTVEQNDVGYNGTDGLLVTWKTDDVTVRRNSAHHHLLWGHPDNLQLYRGVTNVRFQQNLFLAGGQSVMMEETRDGCFDGNMIVGCGAYMLIFGHGNAGHYQVHNNTLAFSGYGLMSLTWEGYDVRENVMASGHGSALFGTKGVEGYTADRNVFWNSGRSENPMILATDTGWHRDFDRVRASTGQDEHSVYADPKFRNAPVAFRVLDSRRLNECTKETWYVRGGAEGFRAGDYIEVNFDGVRRRITRVGEAAITVEPGLAEKPVKGWLVANWGDNPDFRLDLRLAPDSPGAKLSETGGPIGSQIDIQAYLAGDFDGDGRRDVPELPPELSVEE